jgi:uncharacterized Fe-S radical SAM superfamily protein PflX
MPYEKISAQLTKDANEELGPIIDEPISQRVDRINWADEHIDPELAMLAIHILVELLQIPTPQVFYCNLYWAFDIILMLHGFTGTHQQYDGV